MITTKAAPPAPTVSVGMVVAILLLAALAVALGIRIYFL